MRHLTIGRLIPVPLFVRCLVLVLPLVAFSPGTAAAQQTVTIDVFNNDFGDAASGQHMDLNITVGDTVQWVWVNGVHSTTSVKGQIETWNSGDHAPSFTFEHTFSNAGTFQYYCDLHGFDLGNGTAVGMRGVVTVNPVPEPSLILLSSGLAGAFVYGVRRRRLEAKP